MNAFDIHSVNPVGTADVSVLQFGNMYLSDFKEISKNINFGNILKLTDKNIKIGDFLNEMCYQQETVKFNLLDKKVCVNTVLNILWRNYGVAEIPEKKDKIQDVIRYIYQNYQDPELGLKKIAKEFGYSEVSMSRIFHKFIGINLKNFINMVRMVNVQRLLEDKRFEKKKVIDIAYQCGFDSVSTYYRCRRELLEK